MKLSHYTIIFVIIILPFSIIARNSMRNYFLTLRDQVRLNNVIDVATQDALDSLVELNDEFQMLYFNQRFDVTQEFAEEAVRSFFKTLAVNFNMPYIDGATQSYFSEYVPAIVIIGYDGFFIYSIDDTGGTYAYKMSPKIPYAYVYKGITPHDDVIVNFTLGNYVKMYCNGRLYEGELSKDYIEDAIEQYNVDYVEPFGDEKLAYESIGDLTSDMSIIIAALYRNDPSSVPDFLISSKEKGDIPLKQDYGSGDSGDADASAFHTLRRKVIINVIRETLQQEINSHESYAKILGSTYDFRLPEISNDDWTNSINDISIMSFIQGIKIGTNEYYNNYALGGSRIIETDYIYATGDKHYHSSTCEDVKDYMDGSDYTIVENIFVNRTEAARAGYWPCLKCDP